MQLSSIVSLADRFVPGHLKAGSEEFRRGRILVLLSFCGFVWGPAFALVFVLVGASLEVATALLLSGFTIAAIPFFLRTSGSLSMSANVLFATLFATVVGVSVFRGGYPVSALMWSISVPMLAVLLGQRRAAGVWLLAVAGKYAILGYLTLSGRGLPVRLSSIQERWIDLFGLVAFLLLLLTISIIYETQRRSALLAMERADRAKSEFLARMGHEIQKPLNGIVETSGRLLETSLTPGQREHVTGVNTAASSMLELIYDVESDTELGSSDRFGTGD